MSNLPPDNNFENEVEITESDVSAAVQEDQVESSDPEAVCSQCQTTIPEGAGVATENAVFCHTCYKKLTDILEASIAEQSQNINYLNAVLGGLIGGLLAAGIWWGFTIVTNFQIGLVAVLIGWAVGKGVVTMTGGKRARSLQFISLAITLVSYSLATYWVTRTFVMRYIAENGLAGGLPFFPEPAVFVSTVTAGIEIWDIVFLAIALWQAWKGPAPIVMPQGGM